MIGCNKPGHPQNYAHDCEGWFTPLDAEAAIIPTYDIAVAWLKGKNATLWPNHAYTITGNEGITGIHQAASWLAEVVNEINAIRNVALGGTRTLEDIVKSIRDQREGY